MEHICAFIGEPKTPKFTLPVRSDSYHVRQSGMYWKKTNRKETRNIVLAARRYEVKTRQPGKRNGALGHIAIEIIDYLANLVDFKTGRLEPAIKTMMVKLNRSRDAIVRGLKALRTHGFLEWVRRYAPTGNEGKGVQVEQITNAYKLLLPKIAADLLGRYGKTPPVPDDHAWHVAQRNIALETWRKSLSLPEQIRMDFDMDTKLGQILESFAQTIQNKGAERESANQTVNPSKDSYIRKSRTKM